MDTHTFECDALCEPPDVLKDVMNRCYWLSLGVNDNAELAGHVQNLAMFVQDELLRIETQNQQRHDDLMSRIDALADRTGGEL